MQKNSEAKKESTNTVFYWNGIIDPKGVATSYENTLKKLLDGDYQGLNLEKLVGHNVHSVRLNDCDRLLITTITVQGKPYLMVLDVVLNHDYAKSRFLKPGVLKNYLDLHGKAISEQLVSAHFEACQPNTLLLPDIKSSKDPIQLSRVDFYNQKFILLDTTQLNVATKKSFPLIISGAPGSGKSCIALMVLGQYVESNGENDYPILYVTESEKLAKNMRRSWRSLPIAQNLAADAVQFKSYQQLITTLCPDAANKTFVNKEHCKTWLIDYIKDNRIRTRVTGTTPDSVFNDTDALYQEFRIISGCNTYQAYEDLGERQSLFHSPAEKKWLFNAYLSYQKQLNHEKCIHAPFYLLNLKNQFKLIVVDEAQDLSLLQLTALADLTSNQQICFCEDNRQSLSDNKSKIPFLKQLMHSWNLHDRHTTLSSSYRCPEAVINMANELSHLKSIATGNGEQKITIPQGQTNTGKVIWLDSPSDEELALLRKAAFFSDFAIITSDEYKEEAEKLFNTHLIFTPEEIKGLEYKNILFYRPFDNNLFKEANKVIGANRPEISKKSDHRAKKGQGNEQYGPLFSAVFTGFTRPTDTLCIIQKKHPSLSNICDPLIKALPLTPTKLEVTGNSKNWEQNWHEQVKMLLENGNEDKAKAIYREKLNKSEAEFMDLKKLLLEPDQPIHPVTIEIKPLAELKSTQPTPTAKSTAPKSQVKTPSVPTSTGKVIANSQNNLKPTPREEIDVLLKGRMTLKILTKFLKERDAKKYLYSIPLENGDCLFRTLFYKEKSRTTLFDYLSKNPESLKGKMITNKVLCQHLAIQESATLSPLYYLLLESKGPKILDTLCAYNPKLAQEIDFDSMCWVAATRGDVSVIAELVKHKANLNTSNSYGNTPVFAAANNGHSLFIAELAKHKVNLNTSNCNGETLASIAACNGHHEVISVLGQHNVNLNTKNENDETPAYIAACNDHPEVIAELAKYNANLNMPNEIGETPAYIAARKGYDHVIAELAKHNINFDIQEIEGDTPAYVAAKKGLAYIIEELAKHNANLNMPNNDGDTPAHIAGFHGHADVIEVLAKHNANLNQKNEEGETAAFLAAKNGHANVIAELAKHNADLNAPNEDGETPAYTAAQHGHANVIAKLAKHNADLNAPNECGETPAYTAAENGHVNVIAVLAKYNADLDTPNEDEDTPAYIAAQNGHAKVIAEMGKHGVDLSERNLIGETCAYIAAHNGHANVIAVLAKYNADLNTPNAEGDTPAFTAAQEGYVDVIAELAKHNVNLNTPNNVGDTPAYIGAYYNKANIIAELAKHGVNLNTPNEEGETPAFIAAQHGHIDVIRELINAKADFAVPFTASAENLRLRLNCEATEIRDRMEQFIQQSISKEQMSLSITPYDIALIMGHEEIVKLLLPYKNTADKLTETAKASSSGFFSIANQADSQSNHIRENSILSKLG